MNKAYNIIADRIINQLEKGTAPWQMPWIGGAAKNLVSKKDYRGMNIFLLACNSYASPYWVSYKQAKDLGGNVIKGEKGTPVVFWKQSYTKKEIDPDTGKETSSTFPILRYYTVFNVEQCENIPADKIPIHEERDFNTIEECDKVLDNMPKRPDITFKEPQAYYRASSDSVNMPKPETFKGDEAYYATLFHELTHATGHESRLDRHRKEKCSHMFGSKDYSKEELTAEMGAAFLCGHTGIENKTIDNSAAYIKGWLNRLKNDPKFVIQAAGRAQKAADFILGIDWE